MEDQLSSMLDDWDARETQRVSNAALAIVNSGILGTVSAKEQVSFSLSFKNAVDKVNTWTTFDSATANGIRCLMQLNGDLLVAQKLAKSISEFDAKRPDLTAKEVVQWVNALLSFLKELQNKDYLKAITHKFTLPVNADGWLTACETMADADSGKVFWGRVRPKVPFDLISAAIIQAIPAAGGLAARHLTAIRVSKEIAEGLKYDEIATNLETKLQANAGYQGPEVVLLMQLLVTLESVDPKYKDLTNRLASQGHLLHHFHQTFSQKSNDASAWLLYLFLRAVPTAAEPGAVNNSAAGFQQLGTLFSDPASQAELTKKFVDVLIANDNLSLILTVLDAAPPTHAWLATCVAELATREQIKKLFTLDVLEKRADFIRKIVDKGKRYKGTLDTIVKGLIEQALLIEEILKTKFEPTKAWLYSAMARCGAATNQAFVQWCEGGCSTIDKDRWLTELKQESELAVLIFELCSRQAKLNLGVPYLDALADHGTEMAAGKVTPSYLNKVWQHLLTPLAEHARTTLRDRLLEAAKTTGGKTSAVFFTHYGKLLQVPALIQSDSKVIQALFSPLVNDRNEPGLAWLAELLKDNHNLLNECSPKYAVTDFKDRVKGALATELTIAPLKESLLLLAQTLEIPLSTSNSDADQTVAKTEADKPQSENVTKT
jgi:hypothetical protein